MWILVANASGARLFNAKRRYTEPGEFEFESFEKVEEWNNEEGRAHNRELEEDRPGRHYDRSGPGKGVGGRSGWEPSEEPKTYEARTFARKLTERLEWGIQRNKFKNLVVAAPPKFLGILRETTDHRVHDRIESEITKDLSNESAHKLKDRLPDLMS